MRWWRRRQRVREIRSLPKEPTRGQLAALLAAAVAVILLMVLAKGVTAARRYHADTTGVAIATVDGSPITEGLLAAEAMASGVPLERVTDPATRKALIARLVDRRLLANAARTARIDESPLFIAAEARAAEAMLASAMAQRVAGPDGGGAAAGGAGDVDDAAARRYMAAHPAMFAGRETFLLDRIVYADPSGGSVATLKDADTMSDVEQLLRSDGIKFDRGMQRLDSASLPPELAAKIAALKPEETFMLPSGTNFLVARLAGRTPMAAPEADQRAAAKAAVRREEASARIDAALKALRAKAAIRYVSPTDRPAG